MANEKEETKVIKAYKGFDKEEWRPVAGYEGIYEVSNIGNVRSVERLIHSGRSYGLHKQKETILIPRIDKDGYRIVCLRKDGKRKSFRVHRLVAQAFIKNPNNFLIVNHKNMDKTDNRIDNLEWCTTMYNNHYGNGYDNRMKNSMIGVLQNDVNGHLLMKHKSISSAAKHVNGNRNTISKHCRNKSDKLLYGSIWRFV